MTASRSPLAAADPSRTVAESSDPVGKREKILEAALRVFARRGTHGARVSDIAREAGIAYGLVYHYFRNKEELLATIFQERWGAFLKAVERIGSGPGTVREQLVSIAALVGNAYRQDPDWLKVLVLEIQHSARFAQPDQVRAVGELFAQVTRIFQEGQLRGELRADLDPNVGCTMFIGSLDLAVAGLVLGSGPVAARPERQAARFLEKAEAAVEVLLCGFAPSEPGRSVQADQSQTVQGGGAETAVGSDGEKVETEAKDA